MKNSHLTILKIVFIAILFMLSALTTIVADNADSWQGQVVRISDGDVITVKHSDNHERLRLYGIDAPEMEQPFGLDAYNFIFNRVNMETVEVNPTGIDPYGRTIAWVYYWEDGNRKCLNEEVLKAGLAWHYKKYSKDQNLADLEKEARTKKVGLWADPIPPWEFRKGHTIIKEYHGNTDSKKYHGSNCIHYNCEDCTIVFKSNEEAQKSGYVPCEFCKPNNNFINH